MKCSMQELFDIIQECENNELDLTERERDFVRSSLSSLCEGYNLTDVTIDRLIALRDSHA